MGAGAGAGPACIQRCVRVKGWTTTYLLSFAYLWGGSSGSSATSLQIKRCEGSGHLDPDLSAYLCGSSGARALMGWRRYTVWVAAALCGRAMTL